MCHSRICLLELRPVCSCSLQPSVPSDGFPLSPFPEPPQTCSLFDPVHCSGWLRKEISHRAIYFFQGRQVSCFVLLLSFFFRVEQTTSKCFFFFFCVPILPLPGTSVPPSVPLELAQGECFLSVFWCDRAEHSYPSSGPPQTQCLLLFLPLGTEVVSARCRKSIGAWQ